MLVIYLGLLPIILVLGTVMTVMVEVPFGNLLKIVVLELRSKQKKEKVVLKVDSLLLNRTIDSEVSDQLQK